MYYVTTSSLQHDCRPDAIAQKSAVVYKCNTKEAALSYLRTIYNGAKLCSSFGFSVLSNPRWANDDKDTLEVLQKFGIGGPFTINYTLVFSITNIDDTVLQFAQYSF